MQAKNLAVAALCVVGLAVSATSAEASERRPTVTKVHQYDAADAQFPEGLAIDDRGMIYTSLVFGVLHRIAPDGSSEVVAELDVNGGYLLGLTIPSTGTILAAVMSPDPAVSGVWRFSEADGTKTRIAGLPAYPAAFPNGITTDQAGNIYVGDSQGGIIWRVAPNGGVAEQWASGPLLEGDPNGGIEGAVYGANGPVVRQGAMYVANTEQGSIVRIPINRNGSAGTQSVYAQHQELLGADGVAFDQHGSAYVTTSVMNNSIVRVLAGTGQVDVVVDEADGLNYPASLSFGEGPLPEDTLYLANTGTTPGLTSPPAVLAVDINVPGIPD
ncbi:SMP-30/gluconolactonase/LRE family protein [Actinokineospora sp. HUAS TT18]|uniref:SMP-30/gluconolactonase/LRE family protein n=1 Tax=Actinokineospora sp. HUAS TT18 TaxID=3447451 RepID=UPI003F522735